MQDDSYQPFTLEVAGSTPAPETSVDLGDTAPSLEPSAAPTPEPAAPATPALQPDPRISDLEARSNEMRGAILALTGKNAPTPTKRLGLEDLKSPDATIETLHAYMLQEMADRESQMVAKMQTAAGRTASELQWRGKLSAESLGAPDRAFDHMISAYVRPAYDSNPSLQQMVDSGSLGDPALVEYGLATLFRLSEWAGDDPVKAYRVLHDVMDGKANEDLAEQIQRVATSKASAIAGPAAATRTAKGAKYVPGTISRMSDAEFGRRFLGEGGGSPAPGGGRDDFAKLNADLGG